MWRFTRTCKPLVYLTASVLLTACGFGAVRAPVEQRGPSRTAAVPYHMVRKGDTLYAIAWEHGLDYNDLASWNAIAPPYVIYPGQRLRLAAPAGGIARVPVPEPPVSHPVPRPSAPSRPRATAPSGARTPVHRGTVKRVAPHSKQMLSWTWPARGRVVRGYQDAGNKGVDIAGPLGAPVYAAAAGRVVYSGSGLIGYGKLIIVKHNKNYLSAYAHNRSLLVKEGDTVKGGQRIARMGQTGARRVELHFEIRKDGKPVDPLRYLPKVKPPEEQADVRARRGAGRHPWL